VHLYRADNDDSSDAEPRNLDLKKATNGQANGHAS